MPLFLVDLNSLIEDNDSFIFVKFRSDCIMRLATSLFNPSKTEHFQTRDFLFF
ncbi:hypothetical protein [Columbia Basin potato purple top phytoplasma]|uniref:hypothetical protein n=1 Tax=Columbia Basin potato purple top phytoplasma TaxID=307134 RepID=UPI003CC7F552